MTDTFHSTSGYRRVNIPVTIYGNLGKVGNLRRVLQEGFEVSWGEDCNSCMENDVGRCGYLNQERKANIELSCFCSDGVPKHNCTDGDPIILNDVGMNFPSKPHNKRIRLILGIAGLTGAAFIFLCALYISYKRRHKKHSRFRSTDDHELQRYLERDNGTTPASIETFLHNYSLERPTRFSYKQLKKYTNNFSQKIGQGGFGSVFKGQLPNGFIIAVKVLDETTNQIETQFLNENTYGDGGGSKWHECQGKEEEEIAMKLEMVGLWCIQFEPSRRPSMRKVVDMLEGTVAIEIPSAPFDTN
ncbi:hypothetical protein IFM89_018412, partial [Coptis chinensis]